MNDIKRKNYLIPGLFIYIVFPLLYLLFGGFTQRSLLKEVISIMTVLSAFFMLGQFYLARSNKEMLKGQKMAQVVKYHKIFGYIFIAILLLHPFFIVLPRFFEAGVSPGDALLTILTTYGTPGIILGLISWVIMLLLGITSILRNKLPLKYTTWRVFHGVLSILFIILLTLHVVGLGRHMDTVLSAYVILLAAVGVFQLTRLYLVRPALKGDSHE